MPRLPFNALFPLFYATLRYSLLAKLRAETVLSAVMSDAHFLMLLLSVSG